METKKLMMTKEGTIVAESADVAPMNPMGILTSKLGCEVVWSGNQAAVRHPATGDLEIPVLMDALRSSLRYA